jgi:hypothetical protein
VLEESPTVRKEFRTGQDTLCLTISREPMLEPGEPERLFSADAVDIDWLAHLSGRASDSFLKDLLLHTEVHLFTSRYLPIATRTP